VHLAEDVAQQVFVALAHKAALVARHPFLGAWLYPTTRNEAANVVRHERRGKARAQEAHIMNEWIGNNDRSTGGLESRRTSGALAVALANQAIATAPTGLAASVMGSAMSGAAVAAGSRTLSSLLYFMNA